MIESISRGGADGKLAEGERSFSDTAKNRIRFPEARRERFPSRLEFNPPPPLTLFPTLLLRRAFKAQLYFVLSFRGKRNLPNRYESLATTIWNPRGEQAVVPPFLGDGQIVPRTEIECRTSF